MGKYFHLDGKQRQEQYKNYISDYQDWKQREPAADWLLYAENIGSHLSGELYTIVTNKAAKGRKGCLVAMVKGTQASSVINVLSKIPKRIRGKVREVTLDMAANMGMIVNRCFPKASKVIDRSLRRSDPCSETGLRCRSGGESQVPMGSIGTGKSGD